MLSESWLSQPQHQYADTWQVSQQAQHKSIHCKCHRWAPAHVCPLSDATQCKHTTKQLLYCIRQDSGQNSVDQHGQLCISVCNRTTQRLTLVALLAAQCAVHVMQHSPNNLALELGHVCLLQVPMSHSQGHNLPMSLRTLSGSCVCQCGDLVSFQLCIQFPHCGGT